MTSSPFLSGLHTAVIDLRATVQAEFLPLPAVVLNQRPAPASWSMLECLEHLNRYSRYYNTVLVKALVHARRGRRPIGCGRVHVARTQVNSLDAPHQPQKANRPQAPEPAG